MDRRRQYDRAYKLSAVRLLSTSATPLEQVALSLGISGSMLRRWRHQLSEDRAAEMTDTGRQERSELLRLRRRCRDLEHEVGLLKKTMGLSVRPKRNATP